MNLSTCRIIVNFLIKIQITSNSIEGNFYTLILINLLFILFLFFWLIRKVYKFKNNYKYKYKYISIKIT
jgi:nitrogen fixation/metabolism regulation signal transduction histidine kinase